MLKSRRSAGSSNDREVPYGSFIFAVRLIFKKAPKWILCLLWGLVAFRLICPFSIESSLSLIPYAEPLSQNTAYSSETAKQARGEILDAEGNVIVERKPVANGEILDSDGNVIVEIKDGIRTYPEKELTKSWSFSFSRIWLLGFAVMLPKLDDIYQLCG